MPFALQDAAAPVAPAIEVSGWAVGAFVAYLAVMVGIGAWSARVSSAGLAEFFLGGRRMNRFVVALSAVVSGRSSWLLLGVTGMAFTRGRRYGAVNSARLSSGQSGRGAGRRVRSLRS